jgi:Rps23 Pro-64 3,4-dihydroxylase Tpa1-like proline 4-hydroxylase
MRVSLDSPLCLSSAEAFSTPFDYFVSPEALSGDFSKTVLVWFEEEAPWKLVETDFYEQYEFSLLDVDLPPELAVLIESNLIDELKSRIGGLFATDLSTRVDVAAHKLIPGQRIRLHNDFILGGETHRLLIQLNRGWEDENGGLLLLFNSSHPSDIHKAFRPIHNTAVGFVISPASNHAVSAIHEGERFTLVYSFYGKNCNG